MALRASIVIPVRNGECVLPRCLNALAGQSIPREEFEIIVIDDGSTDATASVAEKAGVRVVKQAPQGPSVARNRGVEEAQAPIVLFTDGDCAPAPDWVERMLAPFADPSVAGVKGTYTSGQRSLTARFVQREYESKYERMAQFPTIDFIDTYSAGFRRDVFLQSGGYDPSYETASVEDQEFSFRLHEQGAKLLFVPAAKVDHFHVDNWQGYLRKKFKIGYYKALLLVQHPGKMKGDTHTPRSLQLQLLFLFGAVGAAFCAFLFPLFSLLAMAGIVAFLATQIPMMVGLLRKRDYAVLLCTPVMIFWRTLGLGTGLIRGFIRFGLLKNKATSQAGSQ